ncbi:multiple epidermal growth factor-like domains protein 10 isoform X7 [Dreissena polymorpha]|uniref:multiple epidermal growth factor-like domains protein 10 isoform X7 n=1 Tax=Dreissena polymorpha TaxID=45954 RepID=UPI002263AEAC|nr:multiple epidermal growth factor-like domains protein 10 isoform X7 [Dreissena polymorpha]
MTLSLYILLIVVSMGVARAQDCSNCLYEGEHCYVYPDTHQCMFGCKPGWVGDNCQQRCDRKCAECRQVMSLQECTRCSVMGYYGPECNLRCSENCQGFYSNAATCDFYGNCIYGCKEPWSGRTCSEQNCTILHCTECRMAAQQYIYCYKCEEGYFWDNNLLLCKPCSDHCSQPCSPYSGHCSCKAGWIGSLCDTRCNLASCLNCTVNREKVECAVCELGKYPSNGICVSCEDRNCIGHCNSSRGDCPDGCKPGWYGKNFNCNLTCDMANCNQCSLSFSGAALCLKCKPGFYLYNKACLKCPDYCIDGLCNDFNGNCKECISGYYGEKCRWRCSDGCIGTVCNISGECQCREDWYGPYCDRKCPSYCTVESCRNYNSTLGCVECEPGRYGLYCQSKCHDNCQIVTTQNTRFKYCIKESGECRDGCITGFYGGDCSIPCTSGCYGSCNRSTGECESGCTLSTYGKRCDLSCPSNCQRPLAGYQRACDMVTGACENGCTVGFTGLFCNESCAKNCRDNTCDQNGDCVFGCREGYTGKNCDLICQRDCGDSCFPNCLNGICHLKSKLCTAGCSLGWWGESCNISCKAECQEGNCSQHDGTCLGPCLSGYYGAKCDRRCSPYCVNKVCNKNSGSCKDGCSERTIYGPECVDTCSKACLNQACDQLTGACLGCPAGKQGSLCEQDCLPGWYGESCEDQCGNCKDGNPCSILDGTCPAGAGCEVGWTGLQCQQNLLGQSSAQAGSMNMSIGVGVGVSLAVVVMVIVIAVYFLWRQRTDKAKRHQSREHVVVYKDSTASIEQVPTTSSAGVLATDAGESDSARSDNLLLGTDTPVIHADLDSCFHDNGFFKLYKGKTNMKAGKRECCVKIHNLDDTRLDSKDHWTRLMNECELQRLSCAHTNIVQLFSTYQNKNWFNIALEPCMSKNLHNYLLTSPQPDKSQEKSCVFRLLQYCMDVTSAVSHLHQLKILHRQIEASHVYLTAQNVAKLGDFYWAKLVTDQNFELERYVLESSYVLRSPETLLHNQYTFQSDVWSLGLLFWEVLSLGKTPYEGLSPERHRRTVMDGDRPSRPSLAHSYVYRLMTSCWHYSPSDRPDVENVLKQLLDIQQQSVSAPGVVDRALRSSEGQGYTSANSKLGTPSNGSSSPSRPSSNGEDYVSNKDLGARTKSHSRTQQGGSKLENKVGNRLNSSHFEDSARQDPKTLAADFHVSYQTDGSYIQHYERDKESITGNQTAGSSLENMPRKQHIGSYPQKYHINHQTGSPMENIRGKGYQSSESNEDKQKQKNQTGSNMEYSPGSQKAGSPQNHNSDIRREEKKLASIIETEI